MGSLLSSLDAAVDAADALLLEKEWAAVREVDRSRPAALLQWDGEGELPLDEQRRIVQRWIEYEKRVGLHRWAAQECREAHARVARPHVHIALRHYNSNHSGAEFDAVRPLMASSVYFGDDVWFHVNFLARRRNCIDARVQRFFAEVHYDWFDKPVVEACTILQEEPLFVVGGKGDEEPLFVVDGKGDEEQGDEEPLDLAGKGDEEPLVRYKSKCAFCAVRDGILHPSDGEFICGKEGQEKELYWIMNMGNRGFDYMLRKRKTFLDKLTANCSYLFSVFSIWLASLAS